LLFRTRAGRIENDAGEIGELGAIQRPAVEIAMLGGDGAPCPSRGGLQRAQSIAPRFRGIDLAGQGEGEGAETRK